MFDSSAGALSPMLDASALLAEPQQEDSTAPFGPNDPLGEYFGRKPRFSVDLGKEIFSRAEKWNRNTEGNGLMRQWRENFRMYHNADPDGTQFGERSFSVEGEQDEHMRIRINRFRNFLTHILNMTTTQKVAMQSKATNSDPQSLLAAQLYDGVLEYFIAHWKRSRTSKQLRKAVELCLFMSNGYVLVEWDASAGEPYTIGDGGESVKTGDLYVKCRSVLDVYFDTNAEDEEELDYVIVRDYANKYELAEKYRDKQTEILALESKTDGESQVWGWDNETDLVPVYKVFWKSSAVLPRGRMVYALSPDLVIHDIDNPYTDDNGQAVIPLLTVRAAEGLGTVFGYSPGNDVAPIQQAFNMIWSSIVTNEAAFGVGNVAVERGSDISVQNIAGGLNVIEYAEGKQKPEPFSVSSNESQSLAAAEAIAKEGGIITGVNSVVQGNPEDALKAASGRALGLIQAMAVQFQSALQASYQQLVQDFGNLVLLIVKRFASVPQVAKIIGKDKIAKLSPWQGSDFAAVAQVVAEPVNPISKTIAGAREEAEFLVSNGMVLTPEDYYTVKTTGQIEPLIEDKLTRNNLIAQENEQLLNGVKPLPLVTDPHDMHIAKHLILLDSPHVRMQSAIVGVVLQHIQEHREMAAQMQAQAQSAMPANPGAQTQQGGQKPGQDAQNQQQQPQGEQHMPGPGGTPVPVPETANVQPAQGV